MPPPGANGTISVIGRVGQSCADAVAVKLTKAATVASAIRVVVIANSISIERNATRLDRLDPARELALDEVRQEFRRALFLRRYHDADRLEALDHGGRVDGVARRLV